MMKKLIMLLMLLVSLATANAKCVWKSVSIEQASSNNRFLWFIKGDVFKDTCVKYDYDVTNLTTGQTVPGIWKQGLVPHISLPHKGKYRFNLKLTNTCTGCDTIIYDYVDYHYFNHCILNYKMLSTYDSSCIDSIAGEMTKGTLEPPSFCWVYRTMMLHSGNLDKFTDDQWANDSTIFNNGLSWSSKDVVYETRDTLDNGRKLNYKFRKPGRYLLVLTWDHYCHGVDTNILIRFTIDPCVTLNTSEIKKPKPKLIGTYDMMGRPVKHIREDEVFIYIYDDGTRKKEIKK
jgi:hypothetical protein